MSGVRVYNKRLLDLGLTLPGFVERSEVIASLPSLGLLTIAAHTPDNWEVVYKELDHYSETEIEELINEKPDIIAFSSLTARINETYKLSQRFRSAGITTAIGGLHVSALPIEAKEYTDIVIQGEGELIWKELLYDFENNSLKPQYSSLSNSKFTYHFDSTVIPKYELLDIAKYNRLTIQTTRGCPLHCSFCAASRTISAFKKKPMIQIERELNKIFEIWDRPFIELADDNTFFDKKWSKELLTLFGKYKMKWFTETDISIANNDHLLELLAKSNCSQILIGLETANKSTLNGIDKGNWKHKQFDKYLKAIEKIQSYGISVNGCFILGFDTDTKDSFLETEQFVIDSKLSEVQITLLTPFPGTELYNRLKNEGRLLSENYWDKCTLFDVNFIPKNFTVSELEYEFENLLKNVYSKKLVTNRKQHFKQTLLNRRWSNRYEHI